MSASSPVHEGGGGGGTFDEDIVTYAKSFYLAPGKKQRGDHLLNKLCDQMNAALQGIDVPDYHGYTFSVSSSSPTSNASPASNSDAYDGVTLSKGDEMLVKLPGIFNRAQLYDSRLAILYLQHLIRRICTALEDGTLAEESLHDMLHKASAVMHADARNRDALPKKNVSA